MQDPFDYDIYLKFKCNTTNKYSLSDFVHNLSEIIFLENSSNIINLVKVIESDIEKNRSMVI